MTTENLHDLQQAILSHSNQQDLEFRKNAYAVMGNLLQARMHPEYCQFFVDRLSHENDKYVLDAMLVRLGKLVIPPVVNIDAIIACTRHPEPLVRRSAIYGLRASDTEASREALRFWLRLKKEKVPRFELTYALSALGYVGRMEDITLMEGYLQDAPQDVRRAAQYAIENIQKRHTAQE